MASGKVSPRQKMINMMYLVLTAMLALNVSAEVLNSFDLIAESLRASAQKFSDKNHRLGEDIISTIDKRSANGDKQYERLKPYIQATNRETDGLITYIDSLIGQMYSDENGGGQKEETKKVEKPDETEKNYRFWLIGKDGNDDSGPDGRGSGEARVLRDRLNGYINWANKQWTELNKDTSARAKAEAGNHFELLATDFTNLEGELAKDDRGSIWEYHIFHAVPVAANIAMLQKFKNDVNIVEAEIMENIRGKLNEVEIKIDSLVARDAPRSRVVVVGDVFETELFATATSQGAPPTFSGSGSVSINPGGQSATMKIRASKAGVTNYTATLTVPTTSGGKKILPLRGTFTAVKPAVRYSSGSVQILYTQSCNDLLFEIDNFGSGLILKPIVRISNGTARAKPDNANLWTVIPGAVKQVQLIVGSTINGTALELEKYTFQVQEPPKPSIGVLVGGALTDITRTPVQKSAQVFLAVSPDEGFRKLTADARYQILGLKTYVQLSPLVPATLAGAEQSSGGAVATPRIQLRIPQSAASGAKVAYEIGQIARVNCAGTAIPIKLTPLEKNFALTVR